MGSMARVKGAMAWVKGAMARVKGAMAGKMSMRKRDDIPFFLYIMYFYFKCRNVDLKFIDA